MDDNLDDSEEEEPKPFVDLIGVSDEKDEHLDEKADPAASTINPNYKDDRRLFQRRRTNFT